MSEKALAEGVAAYAAGMARSANPHDADSGDWMSWRDGYEQARAVAERPPTLVAPAALPEISSP